MADRLVSIDEFISKRPHSRSGTVVKTFGAPPSWRGDTRSARFVMSSDAVDRDNDIIRQEGLDLTEFTKNPQALLFHSSRGFPVGRWSDLSKNLAGEVKTTEGTLNFLPEGADPDADRAARHVAFGTLRTVSIGFIPKTIRAREHDPESYWSGYEVLESTLVECSLVPIPAQPDAIVRDAGGDFVVARQLIEEILDTWAKTPDGLLVSRAEYERVYRTIGVRTSGGSAGSASVKGSGGSEVQSPADPAHDHREDKKQKENLDAKRFSKRIGKAIAEALKGVITAAAPETPPSPPPSADEIETAVAAAKAAIGRGSSL